MGTWCLKHQERGHFCHPTPQPLQGRGLLRACRGLSSNPIQPNPGAHLAAQFEPGILLPPPVVLSDLVPEGTEAFEAEPAVPLLLLLIVPLLCLVLGIHLGEALAGWRCWKLLGLAACRSGLDVWSLLVPPGPAMIELV